MLRYDASRTTAPIDDGPLIDGVADGSEGSWGLVRAVMSRPRVTMRNNAANNAAREF